VILCASPTGLAIIALLLASAPALPVRLALAAALAAAVRPVLLELVGRGGPRTVKVLLWDARGEWWLTDRDGVCVPARLTGAAIFGALVFLRFRDAAGRRRRAMLDADGREPCAGRALLGRLRLTSNGDSRAAC